MATSGSRSDTSQREKIQKVFIQRDYSEGTSVKFQTKFPSELEGLIDRHLFEQTINTLNRIYAEAEKTSSTTFCEGCLACITSYLIYLCIETHYQKCLGRIASYLDDQNETVYLPRGLLNLLTCERTIYHLICVRTCCNHYQLMPLLCEGSCPKLTSDVIKHLKEVRILTATSFVSANIEELAKQTIVPYKDLVCIQHCLLSRFNGFPQRADSLYRVLVESLCIISSGSQRVDNFLNGGIYAGEVTEIFGPPGSGKTQFCLTIAASLVLHSESTALYLDSNNNFSAHRFQQIISKRCVDKMASPEKMEKLNLINVRDIYHLLALLESIKKGLAEKRNTVFAHLKLIVIDSIANLLSPCFGANFLDGSCFMSNVSQFFKSICSQHMVSILVCNNTVQAAMHDIKAGLGPNWKYIPSVSMCIKPLSKSNSRKLTVVKSCRSVLGRETNFVINEAGISN